MKNKLLWILVLVPILVLAGVTKKTQTVISATTTPQTLFAKNKNRKGLIISNFGVNSIVVQFGASTASDLAGMTIGVSSGHEFQNVPMDAIYVKLRSSAGTGSPHVGGIEFE